MISYKNVVEEDGDGVHDRRQVRLSVMKDQIKVRKYIVNVEDERERKLRGKYSDNGNKSNDTGIER